MNCPKCKYPNQPGATYCGLCYEVLNRSAADAYLRGIQRERLQAQRQNERSNRIKGLGDMLSDAGEVAKQVDWRGISSGGMSLARRYRKGLAWALAALALVAAVYWMHSSPFLQNLVGYRLEYRFSRKKPIKFLVEFENQGKSWSERQGHLDTPLPSWHITQLGNVMLQTVKEDSQKGETRVGIRPQEWIEIAYHDDQGQSRSIPLDHPSVAPASVLLDRHGTVRQRDASPSVRLGKSVQFLMPAFPKGAMRRGRHWSEPVQWVESFGDWRIAWSGELDWTLLNEELCGADACAHLLYHARVQPQLRQVPDWAKGHVGGARYDGSAEGDALFDSSREQLFANSFKQHGLLRIPITDLGRIPYELRVGRRVKDVPGEIVMQLTNRIDIRKN